jgi:hypothetical protein
LYRFRAPSDLKPITFKYDNSKAEELLKAGFGVVNTHIPDGIAQGTGALVALNNEDQGIRLLIKLAIILVFQEV